MIKKLFILISVLFLLEFADAKKSTIVKKTVHKIPKKVAPKPAVHKTPSVSPMPKN
jgi:hypothetical protein